MCVCASVCCVLTDAWCHWGAALLVALGTAVTGDARHPVLAWTLACRLVTRLPCRAHRVAVTSCRGEGGGREGEGEGESDREAVREREGDMGKEGKEQEGRDIG